MTCPCDLNPLAAPPWIAPGLSRLPHPVLDFNSLRAAMLGSIRDFPALDDWRARDADDLGVMLLEFMAYAGHSISFYSWAAANEAYLGTAWRDTTLNGLVTLIGYMPRPGSPASAELAAIATGTRPVTVPLGNQFRSGAFGAEAPQVFETTAEMEIHPKANSWQIRAPRRATLSDTLYTAATLDLLPARCDLAAEDIVLIRTPSGLRGAFTVMDVTDAAQADGTPVRRATFDRALNLPAHTPVAGIEVQKAGATASLYTAPHDPDFIELLIAYLPPLPPVTTFTLDRVRSDFKAGGSVIVKRGDDLRWFDIATARSTLIQIAAARTINTEITTDDGAITSSTILPAIRTGVTKLTLDVDFNTSSRRLPAYNAYVPGSGLEDFEILGNFRTAARVAAPPVMEIWPDTALALQPGADRRVTMPPDPERSRRFLFADVNGLGYAANGSLDPATGVFEFETAEDWPEPLVPPVTLFGNVLPVRRGETIRGEVIGSGDRGQPGQEFALAKSPVAFLPDLAGTTQRGFRSTVSLKVDGVRWDEVEDLAIAGPGDEVFALRQTAEGETVLRTGDGINGRRLPSGRGNLLADYIFGAGEAAPPSDGINQIGQPVEGLSSVTNPVAASGGADPEDGTAVRANAPAMAMLLGRIVSLDDVLAVAQTFPGVTAARADWVWHPTLQTAAIELRCIAPAAVRDDLAVKIANLSEPGLSVAVEEALSRPLRLSLSVLSDPRRDATEVEDALRHALLDAPHAPLAIARIGIGAPLFRSQLFDWALEVPGVIAVTAMSHDGAAFDETGLRPGGEHYFDIPAGGLVINGREGYADDE